MVEQDMKSPRLKALQGDMWKSGYESKELLGHVYSDVLPMLQWMQTKKNNVSVYIYSSGSVAAQKLLFGHSVSGDLCQYLQGYFDIHTAGPKIYGNSYINIAKTIGVDPSAIVFVSDAETELLAARQAGIQKAIMSIRPGNAVLTTIGKTYFPAVYSLLQLCGE
jgi:2,3-diketo-5-methylthio-1-phosphopentane phosphatase